MVGKNYPHYAESRLHAGDPLPSPVGWDQRICQIQPGPFSLWEKPLDFSEDLYVEDIDLSEGSIRVDGVIAKNRLQIGIFESENYRLLGAGGSSYICTLTYDGSLWDSIAAAPSRRVTFNAKPQLTHKLFFTQGWGDPDPDDGIPGCLRFFGPSREREHSEVFNNDETDA